MDAAKYIELLEVEIEELKCQVAWKFSNGENEFLEYLKSLEPQNLKVKIILNNKKDRSSIIMQQLIFFYFAQDLTSSVREDVVLSKNTFVKWLLRSGDREVVDFTQSRVKTRFKLTNLMKLTRIEVYNNK